MRFLLQFKTGRRNQICTPSKSVQTKGDTSFIRLVAPIESDKCSRACDDACISMVFKVPAKFD